MDAGSQILLKPDEIEIKDKHFFQVDVIKVVMIFLVIYDHTITWVIKREIGVSLWERISIPVFLVIMGFNMGLSFSKMEDKRLRKLYSWQYFKRKFWRYLYPFIVLWLISSLIGLAINEFDLDALNQYESGSWHFYHLFIGILPFWGPGNWFLPVIFWTILIMPLIYKGFSGKLIWRVFTLLLCFLIEWSLQMALFNIFGPPPFTSWEAFYKYLFIVTSPFFMLSAIGLGMWFSKKPNLFAKQNLFMWILFPISLYYLIQYQFFDFRFEFIRGDYNLFVFPYSAFLVLLGIKLLPNRWDNWFTKVFSTIGKATYHILLTQILYFSVAYSLYGDHYGASIFGINTVYDFPLNNADFLTILGYLIINWVICIPFGVFWYYIDFELRNYYLRHKKLKHREEES
ncbi:MAG: acyltransferase [Candidatus Lokiarchaeota archaeon]|nr:acyltransferase [Candidatus Lokiarchaeota archaeon]